jgi:hypothetical protein
MTMSHPRVAMALPRRMRPGWNRPGQEYPPPDLAPSLLPTEQSLPEPEPMPTTPDPIPPNDPPSDQSPPLIPLTFKGVTIRESSDGYMFMGDLRQADPRLVKVPFANWVKVKGKLIMERIARELDIPVPALCRSESRRSTWLHPRVACSWVEGYSPELYAFLAQARPFPGPSVRLPSLAPPPPAPAARAPDPEVSRLSTELAELRGQLAALRLLAEKVHALESRLAESPPAALAAPPPAPSIPAAAPARQEPTPRRSHYTVMGWVSLMGLSVRFRSDAGKALTRLCRERGWQGEIKKEHVTGSAYDTVNSYPVKALRALDWSRY